MEFKILHKEGKARTGIIKTAHGEIKTPAFIPVATKGTVKAITGKQFEEMGFDSLLCNTYHLYLQPGVKVIKKFQGLHNFMGYNKPIWTDSGGFQVFSLKVNFCISRTSSEFSIRSATGGKLCLLCSSQGGKVRESRETDHHQSQTSGSRFLFDKYKSSPNLAFVGDIGTKDKSQVRGELCKVNDEGVEFHSHIDDSKHIFTPEKSIKIQKELGADIIFAFDECVHFGDSYEKTKKAMERTHKWAERCLAEFKRIKSKQALFGIIQGGKFKELRKESAGFISSLGFPGYGIGGIFGDPTKEIHKIVEYTMRFLPEEKPKHMLGIGSVEDIFDYVEKGADTFDCVLPTRLGRVGYVFLRRESGGKIENKFRVRITNSRFKEDKGPIDKKCGCYVCQNFSRAYLHHLFKAKELLFYTLATYHNLHFFSKLMEEIREKIKEGRFGEMKEEWVG